jgi:hypothetical protein
MLRIIGAPCSAALSVALPGAAPSPARRVGETLASSLEAAAIVDGRPGSPPHRRMSLAAYRKGVGEPPATHSAVAAPPMPAQSQVLSR